MLRGPNASAGPTSDAGQAAARPQPCWFDITGAFTASGPCRVGVDTRDLFDGGMEATRLAIVGDPLAIDLYFKGRPALGPQDAGAVGRTFLGEAAVHSGERNWQVASHVELEAFDLTITSITIWPATDAGRRLAQPHGRLKIRVPPAFHAPNAREVFVAVTF